MWEHGGEATLLRLQRLSECISALKKNHREWCLHKNPTQVINNIINCNMCPFRADKKHSQSYLQTDHQKIKAVQPKEHVFARLLQSPVLFVRPSPGLHPLEAWNYVFSGSSVWSVSERTMQFINIVYTLHCSNESVCGLPLEYLNTSFLPKWSSRRVSTCNLSCEQPKTAWLTMGVDFWEKMFMINYITEHTVHFSLFKRK